MSFSKLIAKLLFTVLLSSLVIGCDDGIQFSSIPTEKVEEVPQTPVDPPPIDDPVTKVDQFVVEQEVEGGIVDILIVVDNSHSMTAEQEKLADRFGNFISHLGDIDWQIGFINTDVKSQVNRPGWSGRLYNLADGNQYILKKSNSFAPSLFKNTINRKDELRACNNGSGPCPTTTEEPLRAIKSAIDLRNDHNRGFFRDEAGLAVLVLSDEDEKSTGSGGATQPESVIQHVKSELGADKNFAAYGMIIQPGDRDCKSDQGFDGNYGDFVQRLADLTSGLTGSICANDYSQALTEISKRMRKNLLVTQVEINFDPVPGTLEVSFNPHANIGWELNGRIISFETAPPEGTEIHVKYEYLP